MLAGVLWYFWNGKVLNKVLKYSIYCSTISIGKLSSHYLETKKKIFNSLCIKNLLLIICNINSNILHYCFFFLLLWVYVCLLIFLICFYLNWNFSHNFFTKFFFSRKQSAGFFLRKLLLRLCMYVHMDVNICSVSVFPQNYSKICLVSKEIVFVFVFVFVFF